MRFFNAFLLSYQPARLPFYVPAAFLPMQARVLGLTVSAVLLSISPGSMAKPITPTSDISLISLQTNSTATDDMIDAKPDLSAIDQDALGMDAPGDIEDMDASNPLVSRSDYEDSDLMPADNDMNVPLNTISPDTLKTFVAVVDLVRREYVEAVNDEVLFDNAMSGMLTKLDSHAEFLDAEAYENLRAFTQGDVGDVGLMASFDEASEHWVVTKVVPDSSADRHGITRGDYLHRIDDTKLDGNQTDNDIRQLLNGIAGTQVDVVVSKAGRRKHNETLQRTNSHPQQIQTTLVDHIAIIKLPAFQDNTREQVLQSLIDLDAPVAGIVLDMRDNPGGVLTAAVQMASLFMSDTDIVQVKSRQHPTKTLSTRGDAILAPLPVVVLQNRYSASAAEVLASSLQAQKRAVIMGEISYGKGSVQSVIPLNDEQAVKLTVAHYLNAKGERIDGIGVTPDVSLSEDDDWQARAIAALKRRIDSAGIRFVHKDKAKTP